MRKVKDIVDIRIAAKKDPIMLKYLNGLIEMDIITIKQCLDSGINSNCHFPDGSTALHLAAGNGNTAVTQLLLTYQETNPNLTDDYGLTSLNVSVRYGHVNIVKMLLENDVDVNKHDKLKNTPLHNAILTQNEEIVDILLENNADLNRINTFGHTPIFIASNLQPNKNILRKLIGYGADVNLYNPKQTMTLLMECCLLCDSPERLEIIEILLESGSNVNDIYSETKKTALHIVSLTGNLELAKLLMTYGADIHLKDVRNKTAYEIAIENGHINIANLIQQKIIFIRH